jgi:hypothetical protein
MSRTDKLIYKLSLLGKIEITRTEYKKFRFELYCEDIGITADFIDSSIYNALVQIKSQCLSLLSTKIKELNNEYQITNIEKNNIIASCKGNKSQINSNKNLLDLLEIKLNSLKEHCEDLLTFFKILHDE